MHVLRRENLGTKDCDIQFEMNVSKDRLNAS